MKYLGLSLILIVGAVTLFSYAYYVPKSDLVYKKGQDQNSEKNTESSTVSGSEEIDNRPITKHQPLPPQVDLNAKIQYHDVVWLGLSYRSGEGLAAMMGANISNTVNIGYSYDYTTSQLNTISKGTHEILVGFLIGNKYGVVRQIWRAFGSASSASLGMIA